MGRPLSPTFFGNRGGQQTDVFGTCSVIADRDVRTRHGVDLRFNRAQAVDRQVGDLIVDDHDKKLGNRTAVRVTALVDQQTLLVESLESGSAETTAD